MRALQLVAAIGCGVVLVACSPEIPASPSPTSAAPAPNPAAGPSTYLALGDSVAAGVGAASPDAGYVPLLAARLSERLGCDDGSRPGCPLEVRNLAVSGATTATLLRDQLPAAREVLASGPDVRLVTVTIGGNDVVAPVLVGCAPDPQASACAAAVQSALDEADAGVDGLLAELAQAVDAETTVALMTYYDPLAACRLAPLQPLAAQVLEGGDASPGLNDVLRARAAEHGAVVVETRERLQRPEDFVGGQDCLHPSGSGHAALADAFTETVAEAVTGR